MLCIVLFIIINYYKYYVKRKNRTMCITYSGGMYSRSDSPLATNIFIFTVLKAF